MRRRHGTRIRARHHVCARETAWIHLSMPQIRSTICWQITTLCEANGTLEQLVHFVQKTACVTSPRHLSCCFTVLLFSLCKLLDEEKQLHSTGHSNEKN